MYEFMRMWGQVYMCEGKCIYERVYVNVYVSVCEWMSVMSVYTSVNECELVCMSVNECELVRMNVY